MEGKWNLQNAKAHAWSTSAYWRCARWNLQQSNTLWLLVFVFFYHESWKVATQSHEATTCFCVSNHRNWSNKNDSLRCSKSVGPLVQHSPQLLCVCAVVKKITWNDINNRNCVADFHFCCWVYFAPSFFSYLKWVETHKTHSCFSNICYPRHFFFAILLVFLLFRAFYATDRRAFASKHLDERKKNLSTFSAFIFNAIVIFNGSFSRAFTIFVGFNVIFQYIV